MSRMKVQVPVVFAGRCAFMQQGVASAYSKQSVDPGAAGASWQALPGQLKESIHSDACTLFPPSSEVCDCRLWVAAECPQPQLSILALRTAADTHASWTAKAISYSIALQASGHLPHRWPHAVNVFDSQQWAGMECNAA